MAIRNAAIATAIYWVTLFIVQNSGWEVPAEIAQLGVFFVIFFLGVLMSRRA